MGSSFTYCIPHTAAWTTCVYVCLLYLFILAIVSPLLSRVQLSWERDGTCHNARIWTSVASESSPSLYPSNTSSYSFILSHTCGRCWPLHLWIPQIWITIIYLWINFLIRPWIIFLAYNFLRKISFEIFQQMAYDRWILSS